MFQLTSPERPAYTQCETSWPVGQLDSWQRAKSIEHRAQSIENLFNYYALRSMLCALRSALYALRIYHLQKFFLRDNVNAQGPGFLQFRGPHVFTGENEISF